METKILEGFVDEWQLRNAVAWAGWEEMSLYEAGAGDPGRMNVLVVPIPKGTAEEARRLIEEALDS